MNASNPLLQPSPLPYGLPDFAAISVEHYRPAFDEALARHRAEISAIATNNEAPTWENTVEALEASGQDLQRVMAVFGNLSGTDTNDEMEAIAADIYPRLAAHYDAMYHNEALYTRVKAATPPADAESARLHDHLLRAFARSGADVDAAGKQRLSEINQRLSALSEEFGRNLLTDTRELAVHFDDAAELAGLPDSRIEAARSYAQDAGRNGYLIPLELPTVQSEQTRLASPKARARVYEASQRRGAESNVAGLVEAVQLRAERAELLGYRTHADFVIAEETAKESAAVAKLLSDLSVAASTNAAGEHKLLSEQAELAGESFSAADWPYWESKVRERDFSLDEEELRKYFPLDRVVEDGVFAAAEKLYGIRVVQRPDLQGYADDVDVWEVFDGEEGIGLFITDYFGRPSKRGGAWMSSFVDQSRLLGTKPVVVNVMGITKPADGSAPLLNLDELRTVFHEFGHALHGLLSDVRYPTFSGTNVPRDWVEFPSQINENWALEPAIVKSYARHVDTGEVISDEMLTAIKTASEFGQGFATAEYLAASIIDLAWHNLTAAEAQGIAASAEAVAEFEARALAEAGLEVNDIAPRYRSTYFNHIFAGGYSAGYYSYLWAEALDADGFEWFKERGDALREAGQHFRDTILSTGASRDFMAAYREFRGRDKDVRPLLERRNLSGATRLEQ